MKPATNNTKRKPQLIEESVEDIRGSVVNQTTGIAGDVGKSLWEQLFVPTAKGVIKEPFFGPEEGNGKRGGDLQPGQEVSFNQPQAKQEKKEEHKALHREVYFNEISRPERGRQQEQVMIVRKIDEILLELKRLANSTSEMRVVHREMAVEARPEQVGIYHLNFYEFLLTVIRSARQKMEESESWQAMFKSKKKQRQYGAMAKKHGTSFTLSSERTTATQTG